MKGIYIHIPFCAKKCPYCDFYSVSYSKTLVDEYVNGLCRNIRLYKDRNYKADTIYFGGGTPSLLSGEQVGKICDCVDYAFELSNLEITLEANPCTVTPDKLSDYKSAGVNRLSLGVQSADDNELKLLGRLHDFHRAEIAVENAVSAGFENISCDIMLGTQGQTLNSLMRSVDRLCNLPIQHISAYMLKIEQGTPFDNDKIRNSIADEDLISDMYLQTVEKLSQAGFKQYEISNFAKIGFESRHNMKYWKGEEYIGFGASAHSYLDGKRFYCENDVDKYVKSQVQSTVVLEEKTDRLEEYILLGLRVTQGIDVGKIKELCDSSTAEKIYNKAKLFEKNGLCVCENGNISLTPKGFLVSNNIIVELLEMVV